MRGIVLGYANLTTVLSASLLLCIGAADADQVVPTNLIVQGKACIGPPCINGESFGTGTLRLKDTETRIDFINTNTVPFAPRDWRIEANSAASGGAQYLAIKDMGDSFSGTEGGTALFTATAGAPENSLFIDNLGRVGFRTGAPQLQLHVKSGNTPAIRFEQDASAGNTAQIWDIGGNEAGLFFARDVTAGGTFPFRIRAGAPDSSIDIAASGNVGIGTDTPSNRLSIMGNANSGLVSSITNPNGGSAASAELAIRNGSTNSDGLRVKVLGTGFTTSSFNIQDSAVIQTSSGLSGGLSLVTLVSAPIRFYTDSVERLTVGSTGNVGIGTASPGAQLHTTGTVRLAGVANCTAGIVSDVDGDLSCSTSSTRFKHIGGVLTSHRAIANIMALKPQVGSYKDTPEIPEHWLIAEDVAAVDPALAGYRDGEPYTVKTQNVVADLVAVIQEQQRQLQAQERRIEALEKMIVK